jgi:AcrR family transcriptional regulator
VIDRPRRQQLRSPQRAASILDAAARVFARSGYAATSMDEVAAEAAVSKLIVYRHYNSKHELYLAVLDGVGERIDEAKRSLTPDPLASDDPQRILADVAEHLLAELGAARAWPDGFRLVFRHAAREPEFAEHAGRIMARLAGSAEAGLRMLDDPVVRRWMARMLVAVKVEGLLAWLDEGEPARDREMAERLARAMGALVASLEWWRAPG